MAGDELGRGGRQDEGARCSCVLAYTDRACGGYIPKVTHLCAGNKQVADAVMGKDDRVREHCAGGLQRIGRGVGEATRGLKTAVKDSESYFDQSFQVKPRRNVLPFCGMAS
jgi:hypothetical protein